MNSPNNYSPPIFIPLFSPPDDELAAALLRQVITSPTQVVTMPLTGLEFFSSAGEVGRQLDRIWTLRVPAGSHPVLLLLHHPQLPEYLTGLDADFFVGMEEGDEAGFYADCSRVRVIASTDPHEITRTALRIWSEQEPPNLLEELGDDKQLFDALFGNPPNVGVNAPSSARISPVQSQPPVDPLAALAEVKMAEAEFSAPPLPGRRCPTLAGSSNPLLSRLAGWPSRLFRKREMVVPEEIADLLLGVNPAPVVVVGSRKGGVGKTAFSAGLAQVCGYSLDGRAGVAALVDQNINNADQWGRLMVAQGVGTVRQIMAALESGEDFPPPPTYARTPALAVYPESRDSGDGYPAALVERFAGNLRRRHVFSVIDLPNALPAYTSAEAAVAAAYIGQADLVVVPTTDDPNSLRGALEYLQAPSMRDKPAVVPYIVSPERDIRENRGVQGLLEQIGHRAAAVVTFPKTEKATLAVVQGSSILEVDAALCQAYVELATVVARTLMGRAA